MSLTGLKTRSFVVQKLRQLLLSWGYEEYIPQLMQPIEPMEPTIYPFQTNWDRQNQQSPLFLSTSPESYLKKLLATGQVTHCFAISHAFRNLEGEGTYHQPEFLMAEWYRRDATWLDMMREAQRAVAAILPGHHSSSWPVISLRQLWQHHESGDLSELLLKTDMVRFAAKKGYNTANASWEQLFYQIVFNDIEPHFPSEPFFLVDFPTQVSPLAKPQAAVPEFAERFELFIDRVELANGNTENTDTKRIESLIDESLITSLTHMQSHQWAGVGLGIDRLAMMVGGTPSIKDIQWV